MSNSQSNGHIFGFGSRHPAKVAYLRVGIGIYLLVLTGVLLAVGAGDPWAWVTGAFAAVHFALAYRLLRIKRHRATPHTGPRAAI